MITKDTLVLNYTGYDALALRSIIAQILANLAKYKQWKKDLVTNCVIIKYLPHDSRLWQLPVIYKGEPMTHMRYNFNRRVFTIKLPNIEKFYSSPIELLSKMLDDRILLPDKYTQELKHNLARSLIIDYQRQYTHSFNHEGSIKRLLRTIARLEKCLNRFVDKLPFELSYTYTPLTHKTTTILSNDRRYARFNLIYDIHNLSLKRKKLLFAMQNISNTKTSRAKQRKHKRNMKKKLAVMDARMSGLAKKLKTTLC